MDSLYNVSVTRKIPFFIINEVEHIQNRLFDLSSIGYLKERRDIHAKIYNEATEEDATWDDKLQMFRSQGSHAENLFLFRIHPCYGSIQYSDERLAEIAAKSDTSYSVLDYGPVKVSLEAVNFKASPIETNWGIDFDTYVNVQYENKTIFSGDIHGPYWKDDLEQVFIDLFEKAEENIIVGRYMAFLTNGSFIDNMVTLNCKDFSLGVDAEFDRSKISKEIFIYQSLSFDISSNESFEIHKDVVEKILAWKESFKAVDQLQSILDDQAGEFTLENTSILISGVVIPEKYIEESRFLFLDKNEELSHTEKMKDLRFEYSGLTELIQKRQALEEAPACVLFQKDTKEYIPWEEWYGETIYIQEVQRICKTYIHDLKTN